MKWDQPDLSGHQENAADKDHREKWDHQDLKERQDIKVQSAKTASAVNLGHQVTKDATANPAKTAIGVNRDRKADVDRWDPRDLQAERANADRLVREDQSAIKVPTVSRERKAPMARWVHADVRDQRACKANRDVWDIKDQTVRADLPENLDRRAMPVPMDSKDHKAPMDRLVLPDHKAAKVRAAILVSLVLRVTRDHRDRRANKAFQDQWDHRVLKVILDQKDLLGHAERQVLQVGRV